MRVPPQIPIGTKVLTRPTGRVGVIVSAGDLYLVRFPEGDEGAFQRSDLTIYRHALAEIPLAIDAESLLPYVQYRCVVGSTAYGLATESSDVDRRGFYLPPAELHWSLVGVPEQLASAHEEAYWEIEKFLRLAPKANPNVLECLYTPLVEHATPLAHELLAMRSLPLAPRPPHL